MRSLLAAFVALAVLLGRGAGAFAESPDKAAKQDEVIQKIAAVRKQLTARDEATRRAGLEALGRYYSDWGLRETATALAAVLEHDPSEDLRLKAATVLEGIGPSAQSAVLALAKALNKDKSRKVRLKATEALMQIGPCAKLAVPALLEILKGEDVYLRRKAVTALGLIGPPENPDQAVSALIKALKDKDDLKDRTQAIVPHAAAIALGNYGAAAAPAVPALIEATRSPDFGLRAVSLVSLGRIRAQPQVVVPLLIRVLNDKEQAAIRSSAVGALRSMGPLAKEATPSLLKAFACDDIKDGQEIEVVRSNILRALVSIRADVPKVLPLLHEVFLNEKGEYGSGERRQAVRSMGQLGPAAAKAAPVLIRGLNDLYQVHGLTEDITDALAAIGEAAVGPLTKNLTATNPQVLYHTIHALGKLGPTAAPAVRSLREMSHHPDALVASEAIKALQRIERK
jgi:HEAT repeat protein